MLRLLPLLPSLEIGFHKCSSVTCLTAHLGNECRTVVSFPSLQCPSFYVLFVSHQLNSLYLLIWLVSRLQSCMCTNPSIVNANTCMAVTCPSRDRLVFLTNIRNVSQSSSPIAFVLFSLEGNCCGT